MCNKEEAGIVTLVERGKEQLTSNPIMAMAAFKMAALGSDNPEAYYFLGRMYVEGAGVEIDVDQGVKYIMKSAELGFPDAMFYLGNQFYWGNQLEQDYEKAFEYMKSAAEAGNIDACNLLADCYIHGRGTTQDSDQGLIWLNEYARRRREIDPDFDNECMDDEGLEDDLDYDFEEYFDDVEESDGSVSMPELFPLVYYPKDEARTKALCRQGGKLLRSLELPAQVKELLEQFPYAASMACAHGMWHIIDKELEAGPFHEDRLMFSASNALGHRLEIGEILEPYPFIEFYNNSRYSKEIEFCFSLGMMYELDNQNKTNYIQTKFSQLVEEYEAWTVFPFAAKMSVQTCFALRNKYEDERDAIRFAVGYVPAIIEEKIKAMNQCDVDLVLHSK